MRGEREVGDRLVLRCSRLEIQGPTITWEFFELDRRVAHDLDEVFRRHRGPRAPDDVASRLRVPAAADFPEPGGEERVPLLVRADPERFEIPAVVAIVLGGQFGPEARGLCR